MYEKKTVCSHCGGPFGLTRHRVGFKNHLCSKECKEKFLEARARNFAEYRQWCNRVSRAARN